MHVNFGDPVDILAASCCICSILFKFQDALYNFML